jgi:hypothetical protein
MIKKIIIKIIFITFIFMFQIARAEKIESISATSLASPHGFFINIITELTKPNGIEFIPSQKNNCGEAVSYYENARGSIAITWSDHMILQSKIINQNCVIDFTKSIAIAKTYSPYEICTLKNVELKPNQKYRLGNNKNNPVQSIIDHMNTNKNNIKFSSVVYNSSGEVLQGLLNREIDVGYLARGNAGFAVNAGSIKCHYSTGDTKYSPKKLSEWLDKSPLNDHSLGIMFFVKNISNEQIEKIKSSLSKDILKKTTEMDMIRTKVAPTKEDVEKFIERAKIYESYK